MTTTPHPPVASVLGLGTMGASIARLLVRSGIETHGYDPRGAAAAGIDHPLFFAHDDIETAALPASVVIEAVPEDISVKEAVLRRLPSTGAVVASNTSTFMPSRLANFVEDPSRFLVCHFFNPADVVPLVEIVPSHMTSPATVRSILSLLRRVGQTPVVLAKETPGFVANRLQAAMLREALALVEHGVIDTASLDVVVAQCLGPRWAVAGLFGVVDLGGLDIFRAVCTQLFPDLATAAEPSPLLTSLVDDGRLGAKSGEGFYNWTATEIDRVFDTLSTTIKELTAKRDQLPGSDVAARV